MKVTIKGHTFKVKGLELDIDQDHNYRFDGVLKSNGYTYSVFGEVKNTIESAWQSFLYEMGETALRIQRENAW